MPSMVRHNEFRIGIELPVRRLGFGAMRLSGKGVWGPAENAPAAQAVLRRVVELSINFIEGVRSAQDFAEQQR